MVNYKYILSKLSDSLVGVGLGLLFFKLSFGWPDESNRFFANHEWYIYPTLLGTIFLFLFGMVSSVDTRCTCLLMVPMLVGSHGRILLYGQLISNFIEGPLNNLQQNMAETSSAAICISKVKKACSNTENTLNN